MSTETTSSGMPDSLKAGLQAQADAFWRAQIQALDAMQALAAGWFQRRRDGTQAARAAAAAICACNEPLEALRAYQSWATGSLERIAADALALQSHAATLLPALAAGLTAAAVVPAPAADPRTAPARARPRSEAA